MSKFSLYARAYFKSFVFYFVWVFILANLVRLLNFGLDCLDDCYAYDTNPFTLWKATFFAFFTSLAGGVGGILQTYEHLHPKQKKFNRGDEGEAVLDTDQTKVAKNHAHKQDMTEEE